LVFIFDEQVNVGQVFGISIETEENIKRKKNAALGILLNLYKNYSETNPLP